MSQAEAVKVMRLREDVDAHAAQIAELRKLLVDQANKISAIELGLRGKAKVA